MPAVRVPAGNAWLTEIAPATVIGALGSIESKKTVVKGDGEAAFAFGERVDALARRLENSGGIVEFAGMVVELFTVIVVPD